MTRWRPVLLGLAALAAACAERSGPAPIVQAVGSPRAPVPSSAGARPDEVVVQPGDTLYAIARRHDIPIRSLIEANGLTPPFVLSAGRRLSVPQVRQHIVQPGETLYAVSRRYGVDASTLARANNLEPPFVMRSGQALVLPAAVQADARPVPGPLSPKPPPTFSASAADTAVRAEPLPAPEPPSPVPSSVPAQASAPAPPAGAPSALPPPSPAGFAWPVSGRLLSSFGPSANGTHNDGVNIAAPRGTPVRAAADGTVAYAGNELRGFGNLVLLKHADGWMSAYAHCDSLIVGRGERVKRGQVIGRVGETGTVGEPQLHFELRRGTRALDPAGYLGPLPTALATLPPAA
jgi:murein DD-endopeptidase MepM/ murein hydrolase activator NlpD